MERGIAIKERDENGERKREIVEAWCDEERERKCALYIIYIQKSSLSFF